MKPTTTKVSREEKLEQECSMLVDVLRDANELIKAMDKADSLTIELRMKRHDCLLSIEYALAAYQEIEK